MNQADSNTQFWRHIRSVLAVLICFVVAMSIALWTSARTGIRAVQSVDGLLGISVNPFARFTMRFITIEDSTLATDNDVIFVGVEGYPIDDDFMCVMSRFDKLTGVQLTSTNITDAGLSELTAASSLWNLDLYAAPKVTDAGLTQLSELRNLSVLILSEMQIDATGLSQLESLASLRIHACDQLDDAAIAEICRLPKLIVLDLTDSHVTDDAMTRIDFPPNVEELHLRSTQITNGSLSAISDRFPNLRNLTLDHLAGVTDEGIPHLKELIGLEQLSIHRSGVSEEVAASLRRDLPHCIIIHE